MKTRIISALVMLSIFIPILLLGDIYYVIFGSILGLMALWEIEKLEKIPDYTKLFSFFICLFLILYNYRDTNVIEMINFPITIGVFLLYSLSLIINRNLSKYNYKDAMWLFLVTLIIGLMFNSFIKIRIIGLLPVIYCFIISITTDTFAYVGGKMFGKHKLIPSISPNKTIEGSIIGSMFGTVLASFFYYNVIGNINIGIIVLISFSLTILSQVGDLFFSSIKRYYSVKDFSNLIPGHGGIFDRLDSVLFVILGFLMYSLII